MRFIYYLLIPSVLFFCPSDICAKLYKWVDENGKVHFSDKPPHPEETAEDVKEYESIEDNIEPEEPIQFYGSAAENVRVSAIKTKVVKKKSYGRASTGSSGGGSSSSGTGSRKNVFYWVLIKTDVTSLEGYEGFVRLTIQAVDRDGLRVMKFYLKRNVRAGQTTTLSYTRKMSLETYKRIRKWQILRVIASKRNR